LGFPIQIKSRYLPLTLAIILCIITDTIRYDIAVAGILGFAHYRYLDQYYEQLLSEERISRLENGPLGNLLKHSAGIELYYGH